MSARSRHTPRHRRAWPAGRSGRVGPRPSWRRRSRRDGLLADAPLELGLHEGVEIAVEDSTRVARLVVRAEVLNHLVWVQHVASDLVAPTGLDVLALQLPDLLLLLLERSLEEPRLQHLDRHLLVLGLAAFVLALGDDPGGQMRQPACRVGLVDVLAAGSLGPKRIHADLIPVELDLDVILGLRKDLD